MTWRSLFWRTLRITVLRPWVQRRYHVCLRHIAQLELELWPVEREKAKYVPVNYVQIMSSRTLDAQRAVDYARGVEQAYLFGKDAS